MKLNDYMKLKVGDYFTLLSPIKTYKLNGINTLPKGSLCEIIEIRQSNKWGDRKISPYIYFKSGVYNGFFQLGSFNSEKCIMALRETNLKNLNI